MSANLQPILFRGFGWIAVLAACSAATHAQLPKGWFLAGGKPTAYESGIDVLAAYNGHPRPIRTPPQSPSAASF